MATNNLRRFEMLDGMPADIWLTNEKQIGKLIDKHKLAPIPQRTLRRPKTVDTAKMIDIDWIDGIKGGIRVPHFHHQGELYLVKPKQWRKFSKAVVKDLSRRLADSGRVSLPELIDMSNSVGSLTR